MPDFSNKRAILIGADQYKSVNSLNYCGDDVREVGRAFRESLQFKSADILEFRQGADFEPRRNEILDKMGEFLKKGVGENDLLVFYFAGHGMLNYEDKKDYLLPVDASIYDLAATGITVEYFAEKLTKTGCKNVVMFIDACREAVSGERGVVSVGEYSQEPLSRAGIVRFFSCNPKEKSYEIADIKHGSFTYCVLEAISTGKCETVASIDQHLRKSVPILNEKYKKPTQLPFTNYEPAEKGNLAIFYTENKPQPTLEKYANLFDRLGDFFYRGVLDENNFCAATDFLERAKNSAALNEPDTRRMSYIESLCAEKFSRKQFEVAWKAVERSQSFSPPKSL